MNQTCTRCGDTKPITDFYIRNKATGLRHRICKQCLNKYSRNYYADNHDKLLEYHRNYHSKNYDSKLAYHREYNSRPEVKEAQRAYYYSDRGYESRKRYRLSENGRQQRRKYENRRMANDELYAFKIKIRKVVYGALRRSGYDKNSQTQDILGASYDKVIEQLKQTWKNNYGADYDGQEYHIDHIIPLATAQSKEDVIKLNHYTNLQLLTPEDNLSKSDSVV